MGKNGYDNERSYQDELDAKFFKGRKPSEKAPFTSKDLTNALVSLLIFLFGVKIFIVIGYFFTDSVEQTCLKLHIGKANFYHHYGQFMKYFRFFFPSRRP